MGWRVWLRQVRGSGRHDRFWPWLCGNVKTGEAWRIYFSHHAALELNILFTVSEIANKGMPFSAI